MNEKLQRILELIRTKKLSFEDATPLLASLNANLALSISDRELLESLMTRKELSTEQIAEHLLLLRGVKHIPPTPPMPPKPPHINQDDWKRHQNNTAKAQAKVEAKVHVENNKKGIIAQLAEHISDSISRSLEEDRLNQLSELEEQKDRPRGKTLCIRVESTNGEYTGNIPLSLAQHIEKLIPPHGIKSLEGAGFTVEALKLLIEAEPPKGNIISTEDTDGNSVHIEMK